MFSSGSRQGIRHNQIPNVIEEGKWTSQTLNLNPDVYLEQNNRLKETLNEIIVAVTTIITGNVQLRKQSRNQT